MAEPRKIAIDEVVEAAAAGVLRAMDARGSASKAREISLPELVKSGFIVDIIIRAGGFPGPVQLPNTQQFAKLG